MEEPNDAQAKYDQIVAQADQFIAPRLLRPKNDPLYGVLQCGAPLDTGLTAVPADPNVPTDPAAVGAPPMEAATPLG